MYGHPQFARLHLLHNLRLLVMPTVIRGDCQSSMTRG